MAARTDAPAGCSGSVCLAPAGAAAALAAAAAAAVEAVYADLPGGYDVDKEAALYNDSLTYGEMATADLVLLVERVPGHAQLCFADLGSGIGKLAIAAASLFRSSLGVELAPERAAVATAALAKMGAAAPANASCVCADFLLMSLAPLHVVFCHNMVFTRALQRALQLKMDRELPQGAVVFTVLELQYTKRGVLTAELGATYNWAPAGALRPLYEYRFDGPPLSPGSSEDGSPR